MCRELKGYYNDSSSNGVTNNTTVLYYVNSQGSVLSMWSQGGIGINSSSNVTVCSMSSININAYSNTIINGRNTTIIGNNSVAIKQNNYTYSFPNKSGTVALVSDTNNFIINHFSNVADIGYTTPAVVNNSNTFALFNAPNINGYTSPSATGDNGIIDPVLLVANSSGRYVAVFNASFDAKCNIVMSATVLLSNGAQHESKIFKFYDTDTIDSTNVYTGTSPVANAYIQIQTSRIESNAYKNPFPASIAMTNYNGEYADIHISGTFQRDGTPSPSTAYINSNALCNALGISVSKYNSFDFDVNSTRVSVSSDNQAAAWYGKYGLRCGLNKSGKYLYFVTNESSESASTTSAFAMNSNTVYHIDIYGAKIS